MSLLVIVLLVVILLVLLAIVAPDAIRVLLGITAMLATLAFVVALLTYACNTVR